MPCTSWFIKILFYQYLLMCSDGKIEEYNMKKKTWEIIGEIPDFKTSNGLAIKNNRLYRIRQFLLIV